MMMHFLAHERSPITGAVQLYNLYSIKMKDRRLYLR